MELGLCLYYMREKKCLREVIILIAKKVFHERKKIFERKSFHTNSKK